MERVHIPTKEMQTQYHTLLDCRTDLDILIFDISKYKTDYDHALFRCALKEVYISDEYVKLPNKPFDCGVVKI